MSQFQFQCPSTSELDAYAMRRDAERGWTPPPFDVAEAEEALSRSAFVDPISVMIAFLRVED